MELSVSQNLIDDTEIVHHLETARLKSLAFRTDKVRWLLIYDPELHAATGEIAGQRESGRSCSCNQNLHIIACRHGSAMLLKE